MFKVWESWWVAWKKNGSGRLFVVCNLWRWRWWCLSHHLQPDPVLPLSILPCQLYTYHILGLLIIPYLSSNVSIHGASFFPLKHHPPLSIFPNYQWFSINSTLVLSCSHTSVLPTKSLLAFVFTDIPSWPQLSPYAHQASLYLCFFLLHLYLKLSKEY